MALGVQLDFLRSEPAAPTRTAAAGSWRASLLPWGLVVIQLLLPFHLVPLHAAGLLLIVALVEPGTRRNLLRRTPLDLPLALLLLAFAVSTLSATGDPVAARADLHLLAGVALFYLAANTVTTLQRLRSICWALVAVAGVVAAGALFEKIDPPDAGPFFAALGATTHYFPGRQVIRAAGGLSHPNVSGHILAVSIVLLGGLVLFPSKPAAERARDGARPGFLEQARFPALCVLGWLLVQALVFTYSRGAVVGLVGGLVALLLLTLLGRSTTSRWTVAFGFVSAVLLVVAANTAGDSTFADRMASIARSDYGPNHERMVLWRGAMAMVRNHLLTGVGPENFESIWAAADDDDSEVENPEGIPGYHAHDLFLQLAACVGMPAVVALAWLTATTFVVGIRLVRRTADVGPALLATATTAGATVVFLHNLVDYLWQAPPPLLVFWLLPGLLVAAGRLERDGLPTAGKGPARSGVSVKDRETGQR